MWWIEEGCVRKLVHTLRWEKGKPQNEISYIDRPIYKLAGSHVIICTQITSSLSPPTRPGSPLYWDRQLVLCRNAVAESR